MSSMFGNEKLLIALAAFAVSGLFHRSVRRAVTSGFVAVRQTLDGVEKHFARSRRWLSLKRHQDLEKLGFGGENWKPSYVTGTLASTAVFVFLAVCDVQTFNLTIAALGLMETPLALPLNVGTLFVLAAVVSGVYAAWFLREAGRNQGNLIPTHHFSAGWRRGYQAMAAAAVVLVLCLVVTLGLFRAEAEARSEGPASIAYAEPAGTVVEGGPSQALQMLDRASPRSRTSGPGPWEGRAQVITMTALPLALLLNTVLAYEAGPTVLLQLSPLMRITLLGWLVALGSVFARLIGAVLEWTYAIGAAALELVQRIAITTTRVVVTLFRQLHGWAESRVRLGRRPVPARQEHRLARALRSAFVAWSCADLIFAQITFVASAWSLDVELPEAGIGHQSELVPEGSPPAQSSGPVPTSASVAQVSDEPADGQRPAQLELEVEETGASRAWSPFGRSPDPGSPNRGAEP